jgi:hypothetical protein
MGYVPKLDQWSTTEYVHVRHERLMRHTIPGRDICSSRSTTLLVIAILILAAAKGKTRLLAGRLDRFDAFIGIIVITGILQGDSDSGAQVSHTLDEC